MTASPEAASTTSAAADANTDVYGDSGVAAEGEGILAHGERTQAHQKDERLNQPFHLHHL
jgi:hypothetical protein